MELRTDLRLISSTEDHTDALVAMFEAMSYETRRFRFFQSMPIVRREMVRRLCDVDQIRHRSWLMLDGLGAVIGEVRSVADPGPSGEINAELAFAVRDDRVGEGLARLLIATAAADAHRRGAVTVSCDVLTDNRRCIGMLEHFGMRFGFVDGCLRGSLPAGHMALAAGLMRPGRLTLAA